MAWWACVLIGNIFVQRSVSAVEMPYYLEKYLEDEVEADDNKQALLKTRERIDAGLNATYGVVMVATSEALAYAVHTIPIWKAYCKKHGYDFFLQEETLNPGVRQHWTKPRLLMELQHRSKWKYMWLVDPSSLPMNFDKGWQYAIKAHLRRARYKNDKQKNRLVWCPEDCEKEYSDHLGEGACYGPHVSGCIFWRKPKEVLPVLMDWYENRKTMDGEARGLKLALRNCRSGARYDIMLWSDVGQEMGRSDSKFLANFYHDEKLGFNVRDQVVKAIGQNKVFGNILNRDGEHRPEL